MTDTIIVTKVSDTEVQITPPLVSLTKLKKQREWATKRLANIDAKIAEAIKQGVKEDAVVQPIEDIKPV